MLEKFFVHGDRRTLTLRHKGASNAQQDGQWKGDAIVFPETNDELKAKVSRPLS